MHNYIVEPQSRENIRKIVKAFKDVLGIEDAVYVDVVALLDILSKKLLNFSYEVVANNTLPKKVFATTDIKTGKIKIKERIFNKACDGDGFSRLTIAHEIGHFVLLSICGLQLTRASRDIKIKPFMDPEWQADCFAGEFLMGFDVASKFSIKELKDKCGVSEKAARCQYKAFNR